MHDLYNLKEMLVEELSEYGKSKDLSIGTLEIIDKLAHATKNIDKVIECYEGKAYSMNGSYDGRSYDDMSNGRSMRNGYYDYDGGMSGRRGRAANGRVVSRDGSDMARQLREMANKADDEQTRSEIERLAGKLEQM